MPAILPELIVLFLSVALLAWTWAVYTALMVSRAKRAVVTAGRSAPPAAIPRSFSVVVATRDEPSVIVARVRNLLDLPDRRQATDIIVAVDHRATWPLSAYRDALGTTARVVAGDAPGGKATALNAGVRASACDVVVLADSKQFFEPGSIDALMDALSEPGVGGVSGTVRQSSGDATLDAYWRTDTLIRRGQSADHSVVTTTGQISAFMRTQYPTLPDNLICDDLYATAAVVMQGQRVTFAEHAVAIDDRTFTRTQNLQRKIRTLSGLVQVCQLLPAIMSPSRNPIWMHFVSQKLLRLATPLLLMTAGWATVSIMLPLVFSAEASTARLVALVAFLPLLTVALPIGVAARVFGPAAFLWVLLVALYNGLRRDFDVWHSHAAPGELTAELRGNGA